MPPKRSQKSQTQTSELQDESKDIVNSSELITATPDLIPLKDRARLHLFATNGTLTKSPDKLAMMVNR